MAFEVEKNKVDRRQNWWYLVLAQEDVSLGTDCLVVRNLFDAKPRGGGWKCR